MSLFSWIRVASTPSQKYIIFEYDGDWKYRTLNGLIGRREAMSRLLLFLFALGAATTWVAELAEGAQAEEVARAAGARVVRALPEFGPRIYEFAASTNRATHAFFSRSEEGVGWAEEQIPKRRFRRATARLLAEDDPLFQLQWHLHAGGAAGVDAPEGGGGGNGVLIAVVDDGLQYTHPELARAYRGEHSWNFNGGDDTDPAPRAPSEGHGTSAAAVAVATMHNGHCGRGVAPDAHVCGIRLIAEPVTDMTEAQALSFHAARDVDIYTNSWGPADTGTGLDRPGRLTRLILARNTAGRAGRRGLGSIYMWASGNGRDYNDSCAYDAYAGNPYVNAVGALDYTGAQAWYSEGCAALMAVAPSSGAMRGIATADLMGPAGYDPGECTTTFGGTSSATPLAAGIVALLLERHPQLTWRDVRHVIARGATRVNPNDGSWTVNAAGVAHSNRYGFGLLRIPALLLAAAELVSAENEQEWVQFQAPRVAPQMNTIVGGGGGNFSLTVQGAGIKRAMETVVLTVRVDHPEHGRVILELYSPSGTRSTLTECRTHVDADFPSDGWSYATQAFWGESRADGQWEVSARDCGGGFSSSGPQGRLLWMQLTITGV
jgi:subtilisin family serine protease